MQQELPEALEGLEEQHLWELYSLSLEERAALAQIIYRLLEELDQVLAEVVARARLIQMPQQQSALKAVWGGLARWGVGALAFNDALQGLLLE